VLQPATLRARSGHWAGNWTNPGCGRPLISVKSPPT
jgi:hypothetical protein